MYPAVSRALADVRSLHDPDRINAVVVLSDGAGTTAGRQELLRQVAAEPVTEGTSVRIFTVGYGEGGGHAKALKQIAAASGGAFFTGSPKDIKDVYREHLVLLLRQQP